MPIYSFPPISSPQSKALILGTMPGKKSLSANQYYAHNGNKFWQLIADVHNTPLSDNYEQRKHLIITNKLALWDVLQHCERESSADSDITDEVPNDFTSFFRQHPKIRHIFFNGANAQDLFYRHIGKLPNFSYNTLPSTSPANTWKTYAEKLEMWNLLKNM